MKKYLSKYSLSKDYFILVASILITLILLSISHTISVYNSKKSIKEHSLIDSGNRISREIKSSFDYATHLMKFLGNQIIGEDPNDLAKISNMLQGKLIASEFARQQFSWEMFDWSNPEKQIIVSTPYGILKKPIDVSYRNYAKLADKEPWILHFDNPDIGVTSGQWIIPAGMGIADENGEIIGILSTGFNIAKLTKNIEESIDKDISFVILDNEYKIIMNSSDSNLYQNNKKYFIPLLKGKLEQTGHGFLKDKVEYNGIVYSSYMKIEGFPFIILTGYHSTVAAQEFRETLLPGIAGYSIMGIVSLILLLILRKLIVTPVITLSSIADKLARGEEIKRIRGGRTYEINNLALQLIKVKNSLNREKQARKKQKELLKIIRDSDNEKELFLRELYHTMNTPLNILIAGTELIKSRKLGNSIDTYNNYIEMIFNAGQQLATYTTDILNPSSVNVKEVILRCITLQKKKATEIKLNFEVDIPSNIPNIIVDELRIRQIIISILGQALLCIQDNGNIKISAKVKRKRGGKPLELLITIEDDGLGTSERERIELWERAFGNPNQIHNYSRNPDITCLSFPVIRHLIKLHHGTFDIQTTPRVGSKFTATLPYLNKKDLESTTRTLSTFKNNSEKNTDENIIKFPQKNKDL